MPMRFLQYGLIIVPAVLYLLMLPLENEAVYTLYIIIALGLSVWKDFNRSSIQQWLLLLAEILWSCWLIASYGPFMFFLSLSVLYVYIYRLEGSRRWLMFAIQLVANNVALHWHYSAPQAPQPGLTTLNTTATTLLSTETTAMVLGNLLLFITAALSWQGSRTANSRGQLEQVYDELRSKHYELQETRAQLLLFTKQLEGVAQAEERTRISRQLHDDIGHRLIRTKMMSEAALLTLPLNMEQGTEMVRQIRDQLADSMDDMRSTLHKLQPNSYASEAYALDRLLEEVGRDTGVKTNYKVHGPSYVLYPSIQIVLFKNAKEALTNALRHGNASSITVELVFGDQEICMSVSNDGKINPHSSKRTGIGQEGMLLRTQMVGGTMEIQSAYPYTVITRIPITNQLNIL
ncbi:sensor histidine kinase [Paenibacillus xylanexedens]|uniref:histidine kinase n=1 Tax=Paenibacillus xylanexedens TaxID=528191 RepID=A0ABS4S253_PAEXY|nr:sensor histidine kinase [Paenibacillus xylanexedens]MBP2249219.1 signal transduction histidine kinase [Paenibacillus xylanexedens]